MDIYSILEDLHSNITPIQRELLAKIKLLEDLKRDANWLQKELRQELDREKDNCPKRKA